MPLQSIQAVAHPAGNRIDLAWWPDATLPADGVRVVRREGRYPQHPQDGVIVADVTTATAVSDLNLPAERVYYYSLFPFTGGPPVYEYDPGNRAMALATAPNGYAQTMLGLLPAIYHRYDKDTRFLARFLRIGGGQLDQFHSLANFSRRLRQLDKTPGPLLPLLAQWIAWQTDYKRDLNTQRDEIRNAPAIYRRIGLAPTLEATIKRINNWESRSKEYVHNIFASNQPPRLNLLSLRRDSG
jgi:phage tail-like protein